MLSSEPPNFSPYSGGASEDALHQLAAWAACDLPAAYLDFLRATDGGETGGLGAGYFRLWGTEDVLSNNEGYDVQAHLPGFVGIGDDGGPTMLLLEVGSGAVYRYPYSFQKAYAEQLAPSFSAFLAQIASLQQNA